MDKVFISGSMRIKNLDDKILKRIYNIIDSKLEIIIGDASGVDKSIQEYLMNKKVKSVTIYFAGSKPRNNIGNWDTKTISTDAKIGTREFFTEKDIAMAEDSDFGLMIWDSNSTGTLRNTMEMLKRGKTSVVYINKEKIFINIKTILDFENLISKMSDSAYNLANIKLKIKKFISEQKYSQMNLF